MSEKKSSWQDIIKAVLEWLKAVLPLTIFSAIVRYFKRKAWFAEREVELKELELKHHENEEKVENDNRNKSDLDIVHDAIDEGARLRNGNRKNESE